MIAFPAATPSTAPAAETVATAGALELQVKWAGGLGMVAPFAPRAVAIRLTAWPTVNDAVVGVIDTLVTGLPTVIVTDALFIDVVSVTVTVALPAATPSTAPAAETVATLGALELQEKWAGGLGMMPPFAPRAVAVRLTVWPTASDVVAAAINTLVMGLPTLTVTDALFVDVISVTVMRAVPAAWPVTCPRA